MRSVIKSVIAAGFLALLILVGCAVSEKYKTGLELTKENRWEQAMPFFEEALKENPNSEEYKAMLARSRQEVARIRSEKARQAVASTTVFGLPALEEMSKDIDGAIKLDPDNKDLKGLAEALKGKIEAVKASVKSLYEQADWDMQKEDWQAAMAKLRQVNALSPGYEDTAGRLAKAEQEGTKQFYLQGIALSKQEDWKMAAQAFKAAMDMNPNYYDVANLYQQAKAKDSVDYFTAEAEKAGRAQNWERAILLLQKALEYTPDDRIIAKRVEDLKVKAGQSYFEEAVRLVSQGKLFQAAKKIDLVKTYSIPLQEDPAFKELTASFSAKALERADKYIERELWGNALIWYQKIESLNPNYDDLFQKILTAKDNINKRIKKAIAVFDFGSPSNDKDAGKIAANKLIAYLHKNASGDLRIIERENLQSILREMQLGQTGIIDVKSAQNLGKMRGIDTFIMGDVLIYSAKRTDTSSTSQVKVLVDEEDIRNPEFSDWLITHPRPTDEEMKAAPPRTVKKKNYQFLPNRQGTARISSLIEISYKLVDTATGENVVTNTISGKKIQEDKFQDALAAAEIVEDPLEIPTEAEVLDQLTNEKISEMGQSVLKSYQSLEVEYFNLGDQQMKRRNFEIAVERYVDAIYDEKSKGISTPISQKSMEVIEKIIAEK